MRLMKVIKNYCYGLSDRFKSAPRRKQGTIVGGVVGGFYTAIRAVFTTAELNAPLAGRIALASTSWKLILGGLIGGIAGSTFGNRYGQIAEVFENDPKNPDGSISNQTFMMKTWPVIWGIAANAIILALPVPGGNPIFVTVRLLSTTELHVLTTLNGIFVGGTLAWRGGEFIDYFTDNKLVMDLGLFSGLQYLGKKIKGTTLPHAEVDVPELAMVRPN